MTFRRKTFRGKAFQGTAFQGATLQRVLAAVLVLLLAGLSQATAQFPPPPGQGASQSSPFPPASGQASPFPPPPGQGRPGQASPFPPAPGQSGAPAQQASPFPQPGGGGPPAVCETFPAIRQATEKDAMAIRTAGERKATREEVCPLFKIFATSEAKMVKFLTTNQATCGVPPDVVKQVKTNHAKTIQIRNQVCAAGPAAGPRAPALSDALSGPLLPDANTKPGRGTFDTLTGSPLAR
jgi:hypothetical protein